MQELRHLAGQLREEEEATQEIDSQRREMRARIERVTKIDGTLDKLTLLLQEALKELDAKKKASKSVKALQEAVDSQRDKHVELEGLKKVRHLMH